MKKIEQAIIARRIDFMLAHSDISWLEIRSEMEFEDNETRIVWSVACSMERPSAVNKRDAIRFRTSRSSRTCRMG